VSAEGKIVSSNERTENLFGYTVKELQGQSLAMLVPERFRQTQRQYYAAYFSSRGDRASAGTIELSGLHKDGREFPIEISTKQLAGKKGMLVTSAIRDVTQRKQTEQQVRRLNEELELRAAELETTATGSTSMAGITWSDCGAVASGWMKSSRPCWPCRT
jgi:protein-histidine pros-kinase